MSGDFMAVIPARGGSKRAPRKNIRLLGEKPLLAYTIAAARDCGPRRRDLRLDRGRGDRRRSEDGGLCGDAAARRARDRCRIDRGGSFCTRSTRRRSSGWHPKWILTLPPTSPFRRASTIRFFMDHAARSGWIACSRSPKPVPAVASGADREDRKAVSRRAAPPAGPRAALRGEQRDLPDRGAGAALDRLGARHVAAGRSDRSDRGIRHQQRARLRPGRGAARKRTVTRAKARVGRKRPGACTRGRPEALVPCYG